MSKLNFSIALKMTTDQFKRGVDVVKSGMRQVQYQVLGMASALGLGTIGLKNMVSQFVNVARETTRARVALRNISGGAEGFAKNMDFLVRSSNRWGQELNGMTAEFSKFSAAASSAGISIEEQHTIFESFTRSITAFGMSSEDAHLSYLALSQMMSKGKVSSEELRRQLGERMPVAMEAMARAVGVTIQELDGLLKAGKLVSKEVMLPFVKEMEKMLTEVNTDNIETSVNRLKNTFTKLTQDLKVGEMYKKIVDGANKMLSNIQTSFMRIALVIINSIAGAKIFGAFAKLQAQSSATNAKILAEKQRTELQKQVAVQKRVQAENRLNEMQGIWERNVNEQTFANKLKLYNLEKAADKARLNEKAAINAFEVASAAKTTSVWTLAWRSIKTAAVTAFATIKAAMMSIVPMAIIGGITNLIMKIRELRKEAKEIKNIFSEFQKEANNISAGQEYKMLESALSVMKDQKSTQEEINSARSVLQSILGGEIKSEEELLRLTSERMKIIKATAQADFYANKSVSTQDEINSLYAKYGGADAMERKMRLRSTGQNLKKGVYEAFGAKLQIDLDYDRIQELYKVLGDSESRLQGFIKEGITPNGSTPATTSDYDPDKGGKSGDKKTDLQKAEEKYADELKKLTNQKEANAIKTEEYNQAIDGLNKATYEEIAGILGTNAERNKTFQLAKEGVEKPLSAQTELAKLTEDYNKNLKELDEKKRLGLVSEEQYNDALLSLIDSTIDKITSFDKIGQAEEEYIANLKSMKPELVKDPQKESRDTTFDYKKSESDILGEEVKLQEKYAEDIRRKYEDLKDYSKEALAEIAREEEKVTSLSDALKLAQLKEDIENLNMDLFSESIDGVTGFANALDRIANSWSRLANEDMSGFERMVAIINALGDTIKGVTDTYEKLNAVKEFMAQRDKARAAQSVANAATEASASAAVSATKATEATANTAAAATGAASSVASIPYVGPILAVAAVASVLAALANLPKFANGGIVGGLKSGDRNLIRANGGEMIMTTAQQGNLWKAIQSGNLGSGTNINVTGKFELEGSKLIASINNEMVKRSRR